MIFLKLVGLNENLLQGKLYGYVFSVHREYWYTKFLDKVRPGLQLFDSFEYVCTCYKINEVGSDNISILSAENHLSEYVFYEYEWFMHTGIHTCISISI